MAKGEGYLPWACVHLDYLSPTAGGGRSFTRGKGISSVRSGYTSHSSSNTTRKPSVCKQRFTHRKGGGGYGFFFFFFFFFSLSTALCVRPMEWSTGVVWASHKKVSAGEQHQVGSAQPKAAPVAVMLPLGADVCRIVIRFKLLLPCLWIHIERSLAAEHHAI